jgi:hypothetical protein
VDVHGLMGCAPPDAPSETKEPNKKEKFPEESLPDTDCPIMREQERMSKIAKYLFFLRGHICGEAFGTCMRNCQNAKADECISEYEESFDAKECKNECREELNDCLKGKGFEHPDVLYEKFGCEY